MSLEDSTGSQAAREQQSLFSRYQDDTSAEDSGGFRVEVGADGRRTPADPSSERPATATPTSPTMHSEDDRS